MIDLHSHVLPGMDDGSKSVEESLMLLHASAAMGITRMAATSHFYPSQNGPETFLRRRAAAFEKLSAVRENVDPCLSLGAEVYYFDGISQVDEVELLRIEGTPLLLLEMPFSPWSPRMVAEVLRLNERPGLTVLMAHIERYLQFAKPEYWDTLLDSGVLMQSNASFFLSWKTKRKAIRMLKQGRIHFLSSDCHNTTTRPQRMGAAMRAIGEEGVQILEYNIRRYLPEWIEIDKDVLISET